MAELNSSQHIREHFKQDISLVVETENLPSPLINDVVYRYFYSTVGVRHIASACKVYNYSWIK